MPVPRPVTSDTLAVKGNAPTSPTIETTVEVAASSAVARINVDMECALMPDQSVFLSL